MGAARKKLERFKRKHPNCCFCGGARSTEEIEHAPPRVYFENKHRPKSHEFPACTRCNRMWNQHEQVAALTCLTMSSAHRDIDRDYFQKLFVGVNNNNPEVISYIGGGRSHNFQLQSESEIREATAAEVDKRLFSDWLNPWAAKIGYALWYEHSGKILTTEAAVFSVWYTGLDVINEQYPTELMEKLSAYGTLKQGNWDVSAQFFYRFAFTPDGSAGCFAIGMQDAALAIVSVYANGLPSGLPPLPGHVFATTEAEGIQEV